MAFETARVGVWTLAREEIRSLPRQTFALGAIAVVFGLYAPIAMAALSGGDALEDLLVFTWLVAMLVVAIVLAARVAAARRSRFVDSLYTAPLEQRTWLAAQAIVGAFLAALVLVAQLPIIAIYVLHLGVPAILSGFVLAAIGMAAFAVALGLFCGVVVGDSGPGAAAGVAGGLGFVMFVLLLVHGLALGEEPSPSQVVLLRVTALSPLVLAMESTGTSVFGSIPNEGWRPLAGLAGLVGGLAAAAWLAYTRGQSPLGWEAGRGRSLVVALVAFAVLAPVATAAVSYTEAESESSYAFAHGEHTRIAFVPRGAAIADEAFTLRAFWEQEPLLLGRASELDVLVMLLVPNDATVRDVRIQFSGSEDVLVVEGGQLTVSDGTPAGHARLTQRGEDEPSGSAKPVYRLPVVLQPLQTGALLESPTLVTTHTTFVADGRSYVSDARITLDTDIPGAATQLLLAGLPLPIAAASAVVARKIKTR